MKARMLRLIPAAAIAITLSSPTLGAAPGLSFADESNLDISFAQPDSKPTALVAIVNAGAALAEVSFSVALQAENKPSYAIKVGAKRVGTDSSPAASTPASVGAPAGVAGIGANSVSWFEVTFERLGDFTALTGWLVASSPDGTAVAARPLTVEMLQRTITFRGGVLTLASAAVPGGAGAVLFLAFVLALLLVAGRATKAHFQFAKKIGSPKWSFDSWVTNITAAGAFLGTVLGASFFPDETTLLPSGQFAGLNLLAGGLLLGAPLLYQTFARADGAGNGYIFLVTALLAFTAAFTELITLFVALADSAADVGSATVSGSLLVLCLGLTVVTFLYGWHALALAFRSDVAAPPANQADGRPPAATRQPSEQQAAETWSLF